MPSLMYFFENKIGWYLVYEDGAKTMRHDYMDKHFPWVTFRIEIWRVFY